MCCFVLSPFLPSHKQTCSTNCIILHFLCISLPQERPEPPSSSQIHLHDNFHWAWSSIPPIPWKRGEQPLMECYRLCVVVLSARELCLKIIENPSASFLVKFLFFLVYKISCLMYIYRSQLYKLWLVGPLLEESGKGAKSLQRVVPGHLRGKMVRVPPWWAFRVDWACPSH